MESSNRHFAALWAMCTPEGRKTSDQVKEWLEAIPNQAEGPPCPQVCEGVLYEVFRSAYTCRDEPFDRELAETYCCSDFIHQLNDYRAAHKGTLYWREPFEMGTWKASIVTELVCTRQQYLNDTDAMQAKIAERGAVVDALTDNWAVYDTRFITVKCYARLAITDQAPEWPEGIGRPTSLGLAEAR